MLQWRRVRSEGVKQETEKKKNARIWWRTRWKRKEAEKRRKERKEGKLHRVSEGSGDITEEKWKLQNGRSKKKKEEAKLHRRRESGGIRGKELTIEDQRRREKWLGCCSGEEYALKE
ncbi:uncharacterized protein LOC143306017 isoform X2 [Osmia lignaria lignaria]|uniref:uncharacterized protein LOC143306017 isoform X2 n=1 Tax=Osmia lignaria lignaria TaxID=1437193 RepID=UPI00402BE280